MISVGVIVVSLLIHLIWKIFWGEKKCTKINSLVLKNCLEILSTWNETLTPLENKKVLIWNFSTKEYEVIFTSVFFL